MLGVLTNICNSSSPIVKWEGRTGELLGPGRLENATEQKKGLASKLCGRKESILKSCVLTSICVLWHENIYTHHACAHTNRHTH